MEFLFVPFDGCLDRAGDVVGQSQRGPLGRDRAEGDGKFVAAQTGYDARFTNQFGQTARHSLKHLIARFVAVGVVDRLEPVEVDEEHAQFAAQTALGNEVF